MDSVTIVSPEVSHTAGAFAAVKADGSARSSGKCHVHCSAVGWYIIVQSVTIQEDQEEQTRREVNRTWQANLAILRGFPGS